MDFPAFGWVLWSDLVTWGDRSFNPPPKSGMLLYSGSLPMWACGHEGVGNSTRGPWESREHSTLLKIHSSPTNLLFFKVAHPLFLSPSVRCGSVDLKVPCLWLLISEQFRKSALLESKASLKQFPHRVLWEADSQGLRLGKSRLWSNSGTSPLP